MKVTIEMVNAAVKQAVKDEILPTNADMETYIHHYESVKRMLEKAIEAADSYE